MKKSIALIVIAAFSLGCGRNEHILGTHTDPATGLYWKLSNVGSRGDMIILSASTDGKEYCDLVVSKDPKELEDLAGSIRIRRYEIMVSNPKNGFGGDRFFFPKGKTIKLENQVIVIREVSPEVLLNRNRPKQNNQASVNLKTLFSD